MVMGDFMDYCCKIHPFRYRISDLIHYAFITPGENGPWKGAPSGHKYIPVMVQACPPARRNKEKSPDLSVEGFWSEWRESNSRPLEPHFMRWVV